MLEESVSGVIGAERSDGVLLRYDEQGLAPGAGGRREAGSQRALANGLTNYRVISAFARFIASAGSRTNPPPGLSRSSIRKMPPATAMAQSTSATIVVGLAGAKSPKLANTIASQKISKTRNGTGMLWPACVSRPQRAWIIVLDRVRHKV